MSVVVETSIGDLVIDLYTDERPNCCKNFLKLCKIKYYNFCPFNKIQKNYIAQTGDPSGSGRGGESIFSFAYGPQAQYFQMERFPKIKHRKLGAVSMINNGQDLHGSQFFITLNANLDYLDGKHTIFGEVVKGFDVLDKLNEWVCDKSDRPYQDILIFHTVVLEDPYEDFPSLSEENGRASPEPTDERFKSDRIQCDEEVDQLDGMTEAEVEAYVKEREAKTRAKLLEIIGDLPDADMAPPENVLFVCKLNPVTKEEDLELIFSRFGQINSCEIIKDSKTGDSLCYAFIEFDQKEFCESAYFKMDNVLIDDRRIHVDFSQSMAKENKLVWKGKGRGTTGHFDNTKTYSRNKRGEEKEEESDRDKYRLHNKPHHGRGYDLVFDHNEHEDPYAKKYEKDHGHHHKSHHKEPDRDRDRHRSNSSRDRERRRSRSKSRENDDKYRRDRHRDDRDRDHEKKKSSLSSSSRDSKRRH